MSNARAEWSPEQRADLLGTLQTRFERHISRHAGLHWTAVQARLEAHPEKLWSLGQMEVSGGEPDVIEYDRQTGEIIFYDCSIESPKGRRSLCYDRTALDSRKENKPVGDALSLAEKIGIELLSQEQYNALQRLGTFDAKTSSWLATPAQIRALGGAIFGDYRYGTVFSHHNGAESYYAARGFRGSLRV